MHGIIAASSHRPLQVSDAVSQKAILITGGAGYIGSHVLLQLQARGERVVVLDNLYTGFRQAVRDAPLIVGDVGRPRAGGRVLREHEVDTVMHFAANTIVPESVRDPLKYYGNNTCATRNLLEACMAKAACASWCSPRPRRSTAFPPAASADEDMPLAPINPYGTSKLMSEWILRDLAAASDFRYVSLRYFNVAGSDPQGRIGQATRKRHAADQSRLRGGRRQAAACDRSSAPTTTRPDGTGVRDYIHVEDLARAHLDALDYLRRGGAAAVSTAATATVTACARCSRACSAWPATAGIKEEPRRVGDPPTLIARAERIRVALGWYSRTRRPGRDRRQLVALGA